MSALAGIEKLVGERQRLSQKATACEVRIKALRNVFRDQSGSEAKRTEGTIWEVRMTLAALKEQLAEAISALSAPVSFEELDSHTQVYVEAVSGKSGQNALDAWTNYTGFDDCGRHNVPLRERVWNAVKCGRTWHPIAEAS
jgi:hypothetical protein